MIRERGSDKLTERREAGLSVASRMLVWKTHLVLAILPHFSQFILGEDGLVN
jgi:hypothetical protein